MRWPFRKKQFESQGYEAQIVDAWEDQAGGASTRKLVTGYIAAAGSAWAEALALCEVQSSEPVQRALSPVILAQIGRDSILQGGSFYRTLAVAGAIRLERPLSVYRLAQGGGWQVQVGEPSHPVLLNVVDSEVLYMPWQTNAINPYLPVAPWRNATGQLTREMEAALNDELKGPMGSLLFLANPYPYPGAESKKTRGKAYSEKLSRFSGKDRGRLAILTNPSNAMNKGFTSDSVGKPFRIGAAPPQTLALLREQLGAEILASCSIPPAMLLGGSPGPATITARRNFERTIVPARLKIFSEYLSVAFQEEVMLTYPAKCRADNSTAARTVAALEKAGVPLDEAMQLAGLR